MSRSVLCAGFSIFFAVSASAQFLNSYTAWRELSPSAKLAFAAGAWDRGAIWRTNFDAFSKADYNGLKACAAAAQLTPAVLVEILDKHYKDNQSDWDKGPALILEHALIKNVCKKFVNGARDLAGLK